jgi:hypothetical protein
MCICVGSICVGSMCICEGSISAIDDHSHYTHIIRFILNSAGLFNGSEILHSDM